MKKIIIILLLLTSLNLYAFDVNLTAEIGIIPNGHLKMYDYERKIINELSFYGDFYLEPTFIDNHLFIGVGLKVFLWKVTDGITFRPDRINFLFNTGLRLFDNNLEIGFRHYCNHPIKAWDTGTNTYLENWYEEIYIKLNFKLNIGGIK